jgi:hypothetical protein
MSTLGRVLLGIAAAVGGTALAHHGHAIGRTIAFFAIFAVMSAVLRHFGIGGASAQDGGSPEASGDGACGGDGCGGDGCGGCSA